MSNSYPNIIFIVPYRNRVTHKLFFSKYMGSNLKDKNNYEIYFSHQSDERPFNRGACKNIGFLAMKHKYPENYKEISFIFNDIDTIPFTDILDYQTSKGIVKHFYGFDYALGGIVSILGEDFEKINGFPNYWGWGMEDAILQKRCENKNVYIDRNNFYSIGSPEILHLFDGVARIINKKETIQSKKDNGMNGLTTLYKIKYYTDIKSSNSLDNLYNDKNKNNTDEKKECIYFINILDFQCSTLPDKEQFYEYDLREPKTRIMNTNRIKAKNEIVNNNWTKIPFYPTSIQKQEMVNRYGLEKTNEMIEFNLQN